MKLCVGDGTGGESDPYWEKLPVHEREERNCEQMIRKTQVTSHRHKVRDNSKRINVAFKDTGNLRCRGLSGIKGW